MIDIAPLDSIERYTKQSNHMAYLTHQNCAITTFTMDNEANK